MSDHNAIISYAVNHPGITVEELRDRYGALDPQQAEGLLETASHMWLDLYDGYDEYLEETDHTDTDRLAAMGV